MTSPDPALERQPYGGDAKRERPIHEETRIGPWSGRVAVTPITGLSVPTRFEVVAEWTGPGMPDLPPTEQDVDASDVYWTDDQELAVAIARAATDALRRPRIPDLRVIAGLALRR